MLTGVGYISWLLTRFLVWLDAADECGENTAKELDGKETGAVNPSCGVVQEPRGAA